MMTPRTAAAALPLALATVATATLAAGPPPALLPWPLTLSVQAQHSAYRARERLGAVQLNQDSGSLTGAQLAATLTLPALHLGLVHTRLQGRLDYQGFTQLGQPLKTTTGLHLQRLQLQAEPLRRWPLGPGSLGAGAGLGHLQIERAIAATGRSLPTTETLRLQWLTAALDWQQPLPAGAGLRLDLRWHQPLHSRLAVDTFGVLAPYRLAPRRKGWAAAGATLHWPLGERLALQLSAQAETLHIGVSDAVPVFRNGRPAGLSSYPGSRQRLHTGAIGLVLSI